MDQQPDETSYGCQQSRVMDTDEWMTTHKGHGEASKQLNEYQPPKVTYKIYTLVCPCGAKHIISEEGIEEIADQVFDPTGQVPAGLRDRKLEERILRNPAGLSAALRGDMHSALISGEPGGIEAQEQAGQEGFVLSDRLPVQGLSAEMRAYLSDQGFIFGQRLTGRDEIFIECKLAPSWTKEASDHHMWSYLLDPQGRRRASMFFKAAYYDYSAHVSFTTRYGYTKQCCDSAGLDVEYQNHTHVQWALTDDGKEIERFGELVASFTKVDDNDEKMRLINIEDEIGKACAAELLRRSPLMKDPRSYWD